MCVTPKKNHLTEFFHVDYYFSYKKRIIGIMGLSKAPVSVIAFMEAWHDIKPVLGVYDESSNR